MLKKIILGGIIVILALFSFREFAPKGEKVDPFVYFDEFKTNGVNVVYKDQRIGIEEPIILDNGEIYVAYDFIRNYVNDRIFYDQNEKILSITNLQELIRINEGAAEGTVNGQPFSLNYPIKEMNGRLYVPGSLLNEEFGISFVSKKEGKLFVTEVSSDDKEVATVSKKVPLNTHPQKKSSFTDMLKKGEQVIIYSEEEGFFRVRSEDGLIGYIPKSATKHRNQVAGMTVDTLELLPSKSPLNETVRLMWDQLGVKTAGNWSSSKYANIASANVISPTWFEFEDAQGNLIDKGTSEYISEAKKRGLQVWPLISHNFSEPSLTKEILTSTAKRQHVINQLIEKSKLYGFEGINIDIENIQSDFSAEWVQFMRELSVQLKNIGLTVSVDVYIPSNWSNHYEREKLAEVCDYFIVMAYDQHWSGSEEAGSVSEIPWVEDGIQKNLEEVPKEKLILGMPFYTRIWQQSAEGLKSSPYGMEAAAKIVSDWGVTPVLDEISGQKYAEIEKDNTIYKVWLEDKESISKRIDIMKKYDLAGYAGWKLGLEKPEIWEILKTVK